MKPPIFQDSWSEEVRRVYEHDMREMWDTSIAPHIHTQYQYLLDFYFSLVPDDQVLDILDVGCAQATLAMLLAERGHRVAAVDIRPEFLEYAASRYTRGDLRFIAGNLFEDNLLTDTFDVVFANQIIEHVLEPQQKIERIAVFLKPGGRLVMTTPNGAYFRNDLPLHRQFIARGMAFEENTADADGHVFAFALEELVEQVSLAGLLVDAAGWLETPFVNGHMKFRYLMRVLPVSVGKALDFIALRLPWLKSRLAHQMYVIARKAR